jgi:hypothetical protein
VTRRCSRAMQFVLHLLSSVPARCPNLLPIVGTDAVWASAWNCSSAGIRACTETALVSTRRLSQEQRLTITRDCVLPSLFTPRCRPGAGSFHIQASGDPQVGDLTTMTLCQRSYTVVFTTSCTRRPLFEITTVALSASIRDGVGLSLPESAQ